MSIRQIKKNLQKHHLNKRLETTRNDDAIISFIDKTLEVLQAYKKAETNPQLENSFNETCVKLCILKSDILNRPKGIPARIEDIQKRFDKRIGAANTECGLGKQIGGTKQT